MIFNSPKIRINVKLDGYVHENLSIDKVNALLSPFKKQEIPPKNMVEIPKCYAYFCTDIENNEFICKVYKTSLGTDRWIMLMKDDDEGYAIYKNPITNKAELSWYHRKLEKPLPPEEEKKMITCYIPPEK